MKKIYNTHEEKLAARRAKRRNDLNIKYSDYKEKYILKQDNGCWEWIGCKWKTGYGYIRKAGKMVAAHRYIFALYKEPIPENMCVCHACDNPSCVNPNHLWLGTQGDNMRDAYQKGRKNQKGINNTNYRHGRNVKDYV